MLRMRAKSLTQLAADSESSAETQNGAGASAGQDERAQESATETEVPSSAEAASRAEIAELRAKLAETHDRMLRIAAEADNARKRWDKERDDLRKYAIIEFARELLPVIDAFDKAMTLIENTTINSDTEEGKSLAAIAEGVGMVSRVFHESIKKHGIERVPGKGEPFNPEYHNAIAKAVDPQLTAEIIAEEFVPGYRIGERILRTAMVKVSTPD